MPKRTIFKIASRVDAAQRERLLGQRGCALWFTGLSGSGKSTLAVALEAALLADGRLAFLLDGDNLRHGLCDGLGFSPDDRTENLRRAAEVARLFADGGVICILALIAPMRAARERARGIVGPERFMEIHVSTPLTVCEQRDCKGLYAKARAGQLAEFTGVSAPYEEPEHPDLRIDTSVEDTEAATNRVVARMRERGFLGAAPSSA